MENSRMRLKEWCDRMTYKMFYNIVQTGPGHAPTFSCAVNVIDKNKKCVRVGHGSAKRLRDAQEDACSDALDQDDTGDLPVAHGTPAPTEGLCAWLGDAGAEFLLAMLAYRAGISPATADEIRQQCLTNKRLAETSQNQLTSVAATATAAEAKVGLELSTLIDTILPTIEAAIKIGNPQLVADIHEAFAFGDGKPFPDTLPRALCARQGHRV